MIFRKVEHHKLIAHYYTDTIFVYLHSFCQWPRCVWIIFPAQPHILSYWCYKKRRAEFRRVFTVESIVFISIPLLKLCYLAS